MASLLALPADVFVGEILARLPWPSIAPCLLVCKSLNKLLSGDISLSYKRELCLAGMVDNPLSSVPLTEKLEKLKEREWRWRRFAPHSVSIAKTPDNISGLYELESGTYCFARRDKGDMLMSIVGWQLPTNGALIHEEVDWQSLDVGVEIIDYALSLDAHDLVAVVCRSLNDQGERKFAIHLLQWSTKLPHPSAVLSVLDTQMTGLGVSSAYLRVTEDTLIAIFSYPNPVLGNEALLNETYVWNWKTGQMMASGIFVPSRTFSFLREDLIVIPDEVRFSLRVYKVPISPSSCFILVSELCLPELKVKHLGDITIQCITNPRLTTRLPNLSPLRPFSPDPVDEVLSFLVQITTTPGETKRFICLAHRQSILNVSSAIAEDVCPRHTTTPCTLAWQAWGPDNTRILDVGESAGLPFLYTNGSRFILLDTSETPQSSGGVLLFDFGRRKVRAADIHARYGKPINTLHKDESTGLISTIKLVGQCQPTIISTKWFKHELRTTLPYIQTTVTPWESEDRSESRRRGRLARWMTEKLHLPIPATPHFTPVEWHGVVLSEQSFIGTMVSEDNGQFTPDMFKVLHFG